MTNPAATPRSISTALLAWYDRHARTLPWRVGPEARTRGVRPDPYRVWLSEIMLQQTTVATVKPYFEKFTALWPDVDRRSPQSPRDDGDEGLGRARLLQPGAQPPRLRARSWRDSMAAASPKPRRHSRRCPAIGDYTAAAIAAIAYDEPVAVVDGNIERVIARLFAIDTPLPAGKKEIRAHQARLTPDRRAGDYAQAMMDLGAAICTPKAPACVLCPLTAACIARARNEQARFPVKAARAERPTRFGAAFVAVGNDGAVLLRQRPDKGLLGGMSEVPGTDWTSEPPDEPLEASPLSRRLARNVRSRHPRLHPFPAGADRLSRDRRRRRRAARPLVVAGRRASRRGVAERHEKGDRIGDARSDQGQTNPKERRVSEIQHIVFDLGRVLIHWDSEIPYRRLIPDPVERARFLTEVCSPAWNAEQDRGRTWAEAEALLIADHPEHEDLIRAYRKHWPEMIPNHIEGSVAVLEQLLADGRDVTALTNFGDDTFEVARERYPFLDRFRGVTVSARIGLMKPDAAIFRHHAETFGLDPAATLFFDDSPPNIEGARAAGWQAELFEDAEGLRADLARYGVLQT